jgi:hypothetical protein
MKKLILIYYFMALTWPQGKNEKRIPINLGGQFATIPKANVDAIKYCCFDEIHIIKSK